MSHFIQALRDRVVVVAEIGNNHEGNVHVAEQMVLAAHACGADAVKFQTYKTEQFVRPQDTARFARMKRFELTEQEFAHLALATRRNGMFFISTPLDLDSAQFLNMHVDAFKIASGDNNFWPLIDKVCSMDKPLIVSTGLSTEADIQTTANRIHAAWQSQKISQLLILLHCVTSYPVPDDQIHLRAMMCSLENIADIVGYSDHSLGAEACVAAVALGARLIEKHFTLDKNFSDFRDHQMSSDPPELKKLVDSIRRVERMLGTDEKSVRTCEEDLKVLARRSIVATRILVAGTRISENDITWLRPGNGLQPGFEYQLLGRVLRRQIQAGDFIYLSDVE